MAEHARAIAYLANGFIETGTQSISRPNAYRLLRAAHHFKSIFKSRQGEDEGVSAFAELEVAVVEALRTKCDSLAGAILREAADLLKELRSADSEPFSSGKGEIIEARAKNLNFVRMVRAVSAVGRDPHRHGAREAWRGAT